MLECFSDPRQLRVEIGGDGKPATVTALVYPAAATPLSATLVLAHGAGAGQQSAFMTLFARGLAALGLDVVTFNFLYVEERRRLPDRQAVLERCYLAVLEAVCGGHGRSRPFVFIGGKSMGGRIATQVAAADPQRSLAGLVLLGYPLHPPGRPDQRRDRPLGQVRRPMLFVQGSRDTFGTPAELAPILAAVSPPGMLHVVDGGDHSFKCPHTSAESQISIYQDIQRTIDRWIRDVTGL